MSELNSMPALGSKEAALQTCVSLIARAVGQPQEIMSYILDLYYQLRRAAESTPEFEQLVAPGVPPAEPPAPAPKAAPAPPTKTDARKDAQFKRRARESLMSMRKAGLTTKKIVEEANGNITEDQIRDIIEAKAVPMAVYQTLAATLKRLEQEDGGNDRT